MNKFNYILHVTSLATIIFTVIGLASLIARANYPVNFLKIGYIILVLIVSIFLSYTIINHLDKNSDKEEQ